MRGAPQNQQQGLTAIGWAGVLLAPPLLINLYILLPGALQVARTGICPGTPSNLTGYPCGVEEYLAEMTLGAEMLPVQLLLLFGWIGVVVPIGAGCYFLIQRLLKPSD